MSPSDKMRKAMKKGKIDYTIYGIFYKDRITDDEMVATVSAESDKEAISMLEEAVKDKGTVQNELNPVAEDTGYKTSKKGIIYGYDPLTRSML